MTDTTSSTPKKTQPHPLVAEALNCIQQNDVVRGEFLLGQALAENSRDADALQLLGMIRRSQGRQAEAEDLYLGSIAIRPDQPHVFHNLGNLLKEQARFDEAIAAEREAVRLKPNYAEAYLGLGVMLSLKGDPVAAEEQFRKALRIQPNFMFAQQSLGAVLNDLDRPKEAETVSRRALAAGSRNPRQIAALEHNLGVSLSLQHRYADAIRLFDAAQAKVPEMPLVDYNRANALQNLGYLKEAVEFYRRAIDRNPLDLLAHRDLNQLLYRLADGENFLRSYDDAMVRYPLVGALPLAKAKFVYRGGEFEKSREAYERAVQLMPEDPLAHDGLALAFAGLEDFPRAIAEHEAGLKLNAEDPGLWANFAETLIRGGDAKKAVEIAETALNLTPWHPQALAMLETALRLQGDERARWLGNYEELVQTFELRPPKGYSDMEAFNGDLDAFLTTLHRGKREFIDQSVHGGTQTFDGLFGRGHDLVERLRVSIEEAIGSYIAGLQDRPDHPFTQRRSRQFSFSGSWSVRLADCGYHANHFHPEGWISSAYYVALPDAVRDSQAKEGWIKFGEPAFATGGKDMTRRTIQPRVGTLVLFPSYMWHGTVPFHAEANRTTIAFDAVPSK